MPDPTPTPTPDLTPTPGPWYGTPDAETLGYLQARGLDKMTPDKAALEAVKAHRESEKLLGAPKDQLLRLPTKGNAAEEAEFYTKLGRPAAADKYDFSNFKKADGTPMLGAEEAGVLQNIAFKLNLNPTQANSLVEELARVTIEEARAQEAAGAEAKQTQVQTLKSNWMQNLLAHTVVAENAMQKFGINPAQVPRDGSPIEMPYSQFMEIFRQIGARMGEAPAITGNASGNAVTVEQAKYQLSTLIADQNWVSKYDKGDAEVVKQFNDLTRMIAGV